MNPAPVKRASTFFLKTVLVVIGLAATMLCVFTFSNVSKGIPAEFPTMNMSVLYPGLIGIYGTIIPFLFALLQAFLLLRYTDENDAFSHASIRALRNIKFSGIAMTVLYLCAMPLMFAVAEADDAPGLVLISFAFFCSPLIVSTFAAVLQKLVQHAVDMKAELDGTV